MPISTKISAADKTLNNQVEKKACLSVSFSRCPGTWSISSWTQDMAAGMEAAFGSNNMDLS